MRLYTRTGATTLDDPEYGHFDASPDGAFDLPEELSDRLNGFHVGGRPMWESDIERQRRLVSEEMERRKDPATLLAAVEQIMMAAKATVVSAVEPVPTPAPATPPAATKKAATKKAAGSDPAPAE
jgi:hypothetical protein